MRSLRLIPILFFLFSFFTSNAQILKLDLDSVYVICKYKDMITRIKKDNEKEESSLKLEALDSLKKLRHDTILIGRQLVYQFDRETDDLVKANKVSFFDQRNNKKVVHIEKTKEGKKGQIIYYLYRDADTKNELYQTLIMTWQKF